MPQRSRLKGNKPTFDAAAAGAFLRSERIRQGLSQRDVAARANVGKQTVDNIEHGNGSVTVRKLEAVAQALDLDILMVIQKATQ
jgi:transcriptional regulator with XRE-family HTH domain